MGGSDQLETELKQLIIETLALEDVTVADISSEMMLFGEGLGLDSIDALELGVALQKRYGVKMESEAEENKHHFACVSNLAKFVTNKRIEAELR